MGWVRTRDDEANAGMAMFGGGLSVAASYASSTIMNQNVKITLTMDSPLIAAMAGFIANPAAFGMKVARINGVTFADQDGTLSTHVANRILVQGEGSDPETLKTILGYIDFERLEKFAN